MGPDIEESESALYDMLLDLVSILGRILGH